MTSMSVSLYILKDLRSYEDARREAEEARQRHEGLTVISLEDERRLREYERIMEGSQ